MERVTVTIDDDLLLAVDGIMAARGYETRSEAVRDLLRRGLSDESFQADGAGYAVATLTFVAEVETRDLAQRIAAVQSRHHDLIVTQMQVPLDHDSALHTMVLRGSSREIKEVANGLTTQRGVRHGRLTLIPARIEEHSHRHGGSTRRHQHIAT